MTPRPLFRQTDFDRRVLTYEGRLDVIFEVVQRAGVDGLTAGGVLLNLPWRSDIHEVRAKLVSLRRRDCVFYDAETKRWFA